MLLLILKFVLLTLSCICGIIAALANLKIKDDEGNEKVSRYGIMLIALLISSLFFTQLVNQIENKLNQEESLLVINKLNNNIESLSYVISRMNAIEIESAKLLFKITNHDDEGGDPFAGKTLERKDFVKMVRSAYDYQKDGACEEYRRISSSDWDITCDTGEESADLLLNEDLEPRKTLAYDFYYKADDEITYFDSLHSSFRLDMALSIIRDDKEENAEIFLNSDHGYFWGNTVEYAVYDYTYDYLLFPITTELSEENTRSYLPFNTFDLIDSDLKLAVYDNNLALPVCLELKTSELGTLIFFLENEQSYSTKKGGYDYHGKIYDLAHQKQRACYIDKLY